MKDGRFLGTDRQYLESYEKLAVERAGRFFLNESNVQLISWGTKIVLLDGRTVEFPKLVQKKHLERMLRDFMEYYPERGDCIGKVFLRN